MDYPIWLKISENFKKATVYTFDIYRHQLELYWVFQQEKCLNYPPDCNGRVTETPNYVIREGAAPPLNSTQLRSSPLNSPHTLYLGQSAAKKTSNFFAIFMDLSLKPITNIWSSSSH